VQAGIGFLARLAIRRLGWTLQKEPLSSALAALRPYRGGTSDEPLKVLYDRMLKQIGQAALGQLGEEDDESGEDWEEEQWRPDPKLLGALLDEGVELIRSGAASTKWDAVCDLIDRADGEKVVLFAQPVETVSVVTEVLQRRYGQRPAMIIGNQSEGERTAQVAQFQSEGGPRFLVSSRAGGEGLNMQRAHRLIHLDVPWNPMELEQRIGRVHRFGSRKTIVVETVVAAGSREVDMYRIAREKLALVARHLDPDQFEALFSRVMSLVPPKELEAILGDISGPLALDGSATAEIGRLVTEGFRSWSSFDSAYRKQAEEIRATNPGEARWADLGAFLVKHGGAQDGPEATFSSFEFAEEEIVAVEERVPTIRYEARTYTCGDTGGLQAVHDSGEVASGLGMNLPWVQRALRESFAPSRLSGHAFVKRPSNFTVGGEGRGPSTFLVFLRQRLRQEGERWEELAVELLAYALEGESSAKELDGAARARLIRGLSAATRIKDPTALEIHPGLQDIERELVAALRRPSDAEIAEGVRYAVWPIGAVTMVP